ncbi:hypothetical protein ACFBZI_08270 [Moraxella sp. ZJ142]|uniref:hypothetical protein n=1 Tax=Moraxella marmotae TaxID=3344520 RepID=UPI0035D475A2
MKRKFSPKTQGYGTHWALKIGYLAVATLMLQACQTVHSQNTHTAQAIAPSQLLFSDNVSTPSSIAKANLLAAMGQNLSQDLYSLSRYQYRVLPSVSSDSIDVGSDHLWTTARKIYASQANPNTDDAGGTLSTVSEEMIDQWLTQINQQKTSPFLRYDDQKANRTPSDYVTYEVALSEPYRAVSAAIGGFADQQRECLLDISIGIDDIIQERPTASTNDQDIKERLGKVHDCIDASQAQLAQIQPQAQGYQLGDIAKIRQCAAIYQEDLTQALSAKRKNKSLTGDAYYGYDMAWQNYTACRDTYTQQALWLDPLGWDFQVIDDKKLATVGDIQKCLTTQTKQRDALRQQGITLANNPTPDMMAYREATYCSAAAFSKQYSEFAAPSMPTDNAEADELKAAFMDAAGKVFYDDTQDDTTSAVDGWFATYKRIKTAEQATGMANQQSSQTVPLPLPLPDSESQTYAYSMLESLFDAVQKTPEQLTAQNLYNYDNMVVTVLSHNQPSQRKINAVFAVDSQAPTAKTSIQMPLVMDFNQENLLIDTSAALPLLALASPKYAPLPKDTPSGVVKFRLPEQLSGVIPMPMIYDSLLKANLASFGELDAENFTPMAIANDNYAKQIGAAQVIKLNLSAQNLGKMIGVLSKHLAKDLKAYVDAHPERYSDTGGDTEDKIQDKSLSPAAIKAVIDDWTLINQGYQSDDVGSLLALFEAVQLSKSSGAFYYYLDNRGKLIGMQFVQATKQAIANTRLELAAQVRFSDKPFNHVYSDKLSLDLDASKAADGNAFIQKIRQDSQLQALAKQAREDYTPPADDLDNGNLSPNH